MVGQNEGQGGFGNDLTNVMTADSQEELARRFGLIFFLFNRNVVTVDSILNLSRICYQHVSFLQKQPESETDNSYFSHLQISC